MINLKKIAGVAVKTAFNIAGQIVNPGTYNQTTATNYNPGDGTLAPALTTLPVRMLVLEYDQRETDGVNVRKGDQKVLVQMSDLATLPKLSADDYLVETGTNIRRNVIRFTIDATGSLVTFQTRQDAQ